MLVILSGLALACQTTPSTNQTPPVASVGATPAASLQEVAPASQTATPVATKLYYSTGVVRNTNPSFPSVELAHDEIKGLMPAMQMEFYVKDKKMLEGLKPGTKVNFTLEDKGGAELIVEITKR